MSLFFKNRQNFQDINVDNKILVCEKISNYSYKNILKRFCINRKEQEKFCFILGIETTRKQDLYFIEANYDFTWYELLHNDDMPRDIICQKLLFYTDLEIAEVDVGRPNESVISIYKIFSKMNFHSLPKKNMKTYFNSNLNVNEKRHNWMPLLMVYQSSAPFNFHFHIDDDRKFDIIKFYSDNTINVNWIENEKKIENINTFQKPCFAILNDEA